METAVNEFLTPPQPPLTSSSLARRRLGVDDIVVTSLETEGTGDSNQIAMTTGVAGKSSRSRQL